MSEKLPKGWQRFYFGEAVQIATGQVDPKQKPYSQMLHIGPENIESGTGNITNVKYCAELGLISGKYLFDEHSIIYSKIRPNLNKACMPNFKGVCSADTYPLWPRDRLILLPEYLLLFILTQKFTKQAIAASKRTGMPKINREDLNAIEIILPPLHEQKIIIKVVSTWDAAITCAQTLLDNSRQQKKALMQQLLTGRRRLSGFNGEWRQQSIQSFSQNSSKKNIKSEQLPVLSCSKHYGFIDSLEYFKKKIFSNNLSTYKIICRGEFGYPANHIEEGAIGYQNKYPRALVSPIYIVFKLNEQVDANFVYSILKTDSYRQKFSTATSASVDRRGSLRWPEFSKIKIFLPPLDEQKAIARILTAADALIAQYEARLAHLQMQKKALMQQLLTGKIRVTPDTLGDARETPA